MKPVSASRRVRGVTSERALVESLESREMLSVDLSGTFTAVPTVNVTNGTSQRVSLQVNNTGDSRAHRSVAIDLYVVPRGTTFDPATSTRVLRLSRGLNIAAGGSQTLKFNVPLGLNLATGDYQVVAAIDSTNRVAETDETNNIATSGTIGVTQRGFDLVPTLSATALPSAFAGVGSTGIVQLAITNASGSTVRIPAGLRVPVTIVARPSTALDNSQDIVVSRTNLVVNASNLRPGVSRTVPVLVTFPSTLTATENLTLIATIDPNNLIAETNETNNVTTLPAGIIVAPTPASSPVPVSTPATAGTAFFPTATSAVPVTANGSLSTLNTTGLGATLVAPTLNVTPVAGSLATTSSTGTFGTGFASPSLLTTTGLTFNGGIGLTPTNIGLTPTNAFDPTLQAGATTPVGTTLSM